MFSGALLLSGNPGCAKPPPPISHQHPDSATNPELDTPSVRRCGAVLQAYREHEIPSVHRTLDTGHSAREVEAGTLPLSGTEEEMAQQLTPEGELTGRYSCPGCGRETGAERGSNPSVHRCDGERRIGRGSHHLQSELFSLLGGDRRGPDERASHH
jgi:hypothetical protein